ncbi:hypothetical protein [Tenacibaculum sp. IB213877]|jgi:hypothetical protein|uniref:hypothetical protein n=1 Tax=Tenacibaculum sp. IB213877 TaxID=3097351 RepID=UPI002A598AD1|nr:hypothetical protein [Tenacibaculum sp. IB213877]MDY0781241.1 hypothetical protein [Tenacibaculum sp. IB213877]
MENILKIYDNKIGISFQWKHIQTHLTQIIFRDTGFHLSIDEIEIFIDKISDAKQQKNCITCEAGDYCKSILLQTPSNRVSMAVSMVELGQIEDLLKGTLFQLRLNNYLTEICKN